MKRLLSFAFFLAMAFSSLPVAAQTPNAAAYVNYGNQLYAAKDYAKAISYYKYAAKLDPNNASAFQGLGNAYYMSGQKSEALSAYQQAKSLNPSNTQLDPMIASLQSQVGYTNNTASQSDLRTANTKLSGGYSTGKNFELAIMAGVGVSSGDTGLGFGGHVDGFYFSDPHLGFGGSIGYLDFSYSITSQGTYFTGTYPFYGTDTITDNYGLGVFEIMPAIKYVLDGNGFKPYFVGGVGVALISQSQSETTTYPAGSGYNNTTTNYPGASGVFPMIQAGVGAEMKIGNDINAFGEAKYSLLLSSNGTGSYIPVEVGINFYP